MEATIHIDDQAVECPRGLVEGTALYDLIGAHDRQFLLNHGSGTTISLSRDACLLIRGGETFQTVTDLPEDRQTAGHPVRPTFNGSRDCEFDQAIVDVHDLKACDTELPDGRLFARLPGPHDLEIPNGIRLVVRDSDSFFVIPGGQFGEPIDLEACSRHDRHPPVGQHTYLYRLDRETYVSDRGTISGAEILDRAGKNLREWSLNMKLRGGRRIKIDGDEVDLARPGIERFESVRRQAQQGGR